MSVLVKSSIEENEFSSIKIPHCSGALLTLQLLLVTEGQNYLYKF